MHYSDTSKPWAEFDELKGQKFYDFNKVKDTINELTDKVCGKKGNIVNNPIKLNIHSKTCPDLTVIDLPGITRIPLHNSDQPDNIEEITKNMCTKYCQDKTTIILCVMQANVDISTSEALHMAMKLDPSGDRTIGVLTKLDLMDKGTNAKNLLEGAEVPLKNGYVALKNRSQEDLNGSVPVDVAIQKEMLFFKSHTVYSKMNSSFFGIENLVDKLRKLFFDHLQLFLPGIYQSIKEKITETKKILEELGSDSMIILESHGSQLNYLNHVINQFAEDYERVFAGKARNIEDNIISHTIKNHYKILLDPDKKKAPSTRLHKTFIIEKLVRSEGDRISGFPEAGVFNEILADEFDILKSEVNDFYREIESIVTKVTYNLIDKYFKRFPPLKNKMIEIILEFVDKSFKDTKYICDSIVEMNISYLYIDEKGKFEETLRSILGLPDPNSQPSSRDHSHQNNNDKQNLQHRNSKQLHEDNRKSSDATENYYSVSFNNF